MKDKPDEKRELSFEIESIEYEGDTRKTCKLKKLTRSEVETATEYLLRRMEDELNVETITIESLIFQN